MRKKRESVYCSCGAQWHGIYIDSEYIPSHQVQHKLITREQFVALGFRDKAPKPRFVGNHAGWPVESEA